MLVVFARYAHGNALNLAASALQNPSQPSYAQSRYRERQHISTKFTLSMLFVRAVADAEHVHDHPLTHVRLGADAESAVEISSFAIVVRSGCVVGSWLENIL